MLARLPTKRDGRAARADENNGNLRDEVSDGRSQHPVSYAACLLSGPR